jgi:hypothetical protein
MAKLVRVLRVSQEELPVTEAGPDARSPPKQCGAHITFIGSIAMVASKVMEGDPHWGTSASAPKGS